MTGELCLSLWIPSQQTQESFGRCLSHRSERGRVNDRANDALGALTNGTGLTVEELFGLQVSLVLEGSVSWVSDDLVLTIGAVMDSDALTITKDLDAPFGNLDTYLGVAKSELVPSNGWYGP